MHGVYIFVGVFSVFRAHFRSPLTCFVVSGGHDPLLLRNGRWRPKQVSGGAEANDVTSTHIGRAKCSNRTFFGRW